MIHLLSRPPVKALIGCRRKEEVKSEFLFLRESEQCSTKSKRVGVSALSSLLITPPSLPPSPATYPIYLISLHIPTTPPYVSASYRQTRRHHFTPTCSLHPHPHPHPHPHSHLPSSLSHLLVTGITFQKRAALFPPSSFSSPLTKPRARFRNKEHPGQLTHPQRSSLRTIPFPTSNTGGSLKMVST